MSLRRFALYFMLIALLSVRVLADAPKAQKPVIKMSAMQEELRGNKRRTVTLPSKAAPTKFPRGKKR